MIRKSVAFARGTALLGATVVGISVFAQPIPVQSPLVGGNYVNFDSPATKPLAVSEDGFVVLAVNTPSNWLTVFDASGEPGTLQLLRRVPTGLEPVSVAIQPGTSSQIAWVANFVSDDLSVIDISSGRVLAVIPVGDEPVNILFDESGHFAFVITQGPTAAAIGSGSLDPRGAVSVVDTEQRVVVASLTLDCDTPRAAAYDIATRRLVVAALHSGNQTTAVGKPIEFAFPGATQPLVSSLRVMRSFQLTSSIFASSTLSPWPDLSNAPGPAPLVERIVHATGGAWQQMTDAFAPGGVVSPAAVSAFASQFGTTPTIALGVLDTIAHERVKPRDHDVIVLDMSNPIAPTVEQTIGGVGTTLTGLSLVQGGGRFMVSNLEPFNTVRHEPSLRGNFMRHELVSVAIPPVGSPAGVHHFDLHAAVPHFADVAHPNSEAQAAALANPTDVICDPGKPVAYVAAMGSDRVGVMQRETGEIIGRIDVPRGPRGLVLDGVNQRLYVYCRTDHAIGIVDVSHDQPQLAGIVPMVTPEGAALVEGRNFLFSTRMTNNFASSCALCHIDGDLDHLAWDLGDPGATGLLPGLTGTGLGNHPLKGPMVTQSLRGLRGHEPFHWRGDKRRFTDFGVTFDGLLGGEALSADQMDLFDGYVKSLPYPPNPFYKRDNTPINPRVNAGFVDFSTGVCIACHELTHDGASRPPGATADIGVDAAFMASQQVEFTQLRGLYKKRFQETYSGFGLLHDGRLGGGASGNPFVELPQSQFLGGVALDTCPAGLPASTSNNLAAFMVAFPSNVMPVVGWQRLGSGPLSSDEAVSIESSVSIMIAQHAMTPSRCDIVARGVVGGVDRGYVFVDPLPSPVLTPAEFLGDAGEIVQLPTLLASLAEGDALTFMAVPPGSGHRIGVDIDNDGCLNLLDLFPLWSADFNNDGVLNPDDLGDYITCYFAEPACTRADFNQDTGVNPDDLADFITAFFGSGC